MHRFFIPRSCFKEDEVSFPTQIVHQLKHVLRLNEGERVILLDNSGVEYEVRLKTVETDAARGTVIQRRKAEGEPGVRITLYQCTLKGNNFEYVLQKGTEVGVSRFVPVLCERSVARPREEEGRRSRWERIIQEAAEQSARGKLPVLDPITSFSQAIRDAKGLSLIPWEGESKKQIGDVLSARDLKAIDIFIGPEGGFTWEEVEEARAHGIVPVTLGKRILRAETAGLVAVTAVLCGVGEI